MADLDMLLHSIAKQQSLNNKLLAFLYYEQQLREAEKTPSTWTPYYAFVPGTVNTRVGGDTSAMNAMPKNPNRAGIALQNTGPGTLLFSSLAFSVSEMIAQYKHASGVVQIGVLAVGMNTQLPSSNPLYVASATTKECNLNILETVYDVRSATHDNKQNGWAGIDHHAYNGILGDLVKEMV